MTRTEDALRESIQKLQRSEARLRAALRALPDDFFLLDREGRYLDYSSIRLDAFDRHSEDLVGRRLEDVFPADLAARYRSALERVLGASSSESIEYRVERGGELLEYEARLAAIRDDEAVAIVRDITARKRIETVAHEVVESEQKRIGQSLHDGLGQHLTGIAFRVKMLEESLVSQDSPEYQEVRRISSLLSEAIQQTRAMAAGLRIAGLKELGLATTLANLARDTGHLQGIDCRFDGAGVDPVSPAVAEQVYRLAELAIQGAIRERKAKNIRVGLESRGGMIGLTVSDDGSGSPDPIPADLEPTEDILRSRLQFRGGQLSVDRLGGRGTRIACWLPDQ